MAFRVIIADQHLVVRVGLRRLLDGSDFEVAGEASTIDELADLIVQTKADGLITETHLGGNDVLQAIPRLRDGNSRFGILIYSASPNPAFEARAFASGANAFLNRSQGRDGLLHVLQAVADGKPHWSGTDQRRLNNYLRDGHGVMGDFAPLTPREVQILKLLTTGATNKQISDELKISHETVKEHVQHALQKLGVTDRTQAAVWAVRNGYA